ncbi:MAG: NOG1 family protein [Salinirussus sp.]
MSQPFEDLPTTPTAEELVDQAFSRAARAGRAKSGVEAQQSMLLTAANVLSDNLERVVQTWPDLDRLDPFYRDLAEAVAGVDALRRHLNEVDWAGRKAGEIRQEYDRRLGDPDTARKLRKQAFARMADVVEEVEEDLAALSEAREELRRLPEIRPDEPAVVVAGSPNVGKSTFVNRVTRADNETATYPFTTTRIHVGHLTRDRIRYQLVDTPGLLDRPPEERNAVESQAVSALEHAADAVLVLVDPTGDCGFPIADQWDLHADITARFDVPAVTAATMRDRLDADTDDARIDHHVSLTTGQGVDDLVDAVVAAVGYEPELPFDG